MALIDVTSDYCHHKAAVNEQLVVLGDKCSVALLTGILYGEI